MFKFTLAIALALPPLFVIGAPLTLHAQTAPQDSAADGEVRRIDKDARKITLRHGPIKNLDMPAMTMVFQVKDTALLDKVNTGDKVRFSAEKIGGAYVVTAIETASQP